MNLLISSGVQLMICSLASRESCRFMVPSIALVVRASTASPQPTNVASRSKESFTVTVPERDTMDMLVSQRAESTNYRPDRLLLTVYVEADGVRILPQLENLPCGQGFGTDLFN
jgi:hypothetical protein